MNRLSMTTQRRIMAALAAFVGIAALVMTAGYSFAQRGGQGNLLERVPESEFHMARMVYSDTSGGRVGGSRGFGRFARPGWWAIDYPQAEYHFTRGVRRLTNVQVANDSQHVQIMDEDLFDYPWLFAQQMGQGYWRPTAEEVERLREYLLRGGFLVIDDFHGDREWQIVTTALQRVFPNRPIVDLDTSHEVFHVLYDLDQLTQIPGDRHIRGGIVRMAGPQRWSGIYDDDNRLMVAINFNMDMGDAWEHADDPHYPEPMTALAYRFGINYLIYSMTH